MGLMKLKFMQSTRLKNPLPYLLDLLLEKKLLYVSLLWKKKNGSILEHDMLWYDI